MAKKADNQLKRNGKGERQTVVAFLLDETGSMGSHKSETISGFNEYVGTLKNSGEEMRFTMTTFNSAKPNGAEIVLDGVDISKVPELTDESYQPGSTTPLYDAIGTTVKRTAKVAKGMKTKPRVMFVIQTDGYENASREWTQEKVFKSISKKVDQGWTFVFLGADQDAYAAGRAMGVPRGNTMSYDKRRTKEMFQDVAMASSAFLACDAVQTNHLFKPADDDADKDPKAAKAA